MSKKILVYDCQKKKKKKNKRYNQNQSCFIQAVISSNYVEINQQKILAV